MLYKCWYFYYAIFNNIYVFLRLKRFQSPLKMDFSIITSRSERHTLHLTRISLKNAFKLIHDITNTWYWITNTWYWMFEWLPSQIPEIYVIRWIGGSERLHNNFQFWHKYNYETHLLSDVSERLKIIFTFNSKGCFFSDYNANSLIPKWIKSRKRTIISIKID